MPKLIVVRPGGEETVIAGETGRTAMEVMRDNGIDELLALCGGCCSCSTCHVWVEPAFFDRLPEASQNEKELLECSEHVKPTSRLSCQIVLTDALDGMKVTVAPSD